MPNITKEWKPGILSRVSREAYNAVRRSRGFSFMTPEKREEAAKSYDELIGTKPAPLPLVYNTVAAARTMCGKFHPDKVIARVGFKWALVAPAFAKRMKLRVVKS